MQESKHFWAKHVKQYSADLDGIWFCGETDWSDKIWCSVYLFQSSVKGENPTLVIWLKKKKRDHLGLYLGRCRPLSIKFCMLMDTIELFNLIPKWITLIFIQYHGCMRKQKLCSFLPRFLNWFWKKFSLLTLPVVLLKLMLNLIDMINIQGRESCASGFIK